MPTAIRKTLTDQSTVADSPFLAGERAFSLIKSPGTPPSRVIVIAEDEYLPTREQVTTTGVFAFLAYAVGTITSADGKKSLEIHEKWSELYGFPKGLLSQAGDDRDSSGYNKLLKYARMQTLSYRSLMFLELTRKLASQKRKGRLLIRLAPLTQSDHVTLGSLIESGHIDVAVGMDTTQPDVGERNLFRRIDDLPEFLTKEDNDFSCMSDLQVTRILSEKERTGLFWRYGGRPPSSKLPYEVGSCYVRLAEKEWYSPARLDVIARTRRLQDATDKAVGFLSHTRLIPAQADILGKGRVPEILGVRNAPVPELAHGVLEKLQYEWTVEDSEFHKFYKERQQKARQR